VHDELVFEVVEAETTALKDVVGERMVAALELAVPLVIDFGVGENWREAH
jgi:DNA polymerase-1